MWHKRNRRRRERAARPRSVFPLVTTVEEDLGSPEVVFTALELDFFRRAEELYAFDSWPEWDVDQP